MKKNKKGLRGLFCVMLGLLLISAGLWGLFQIPSRVQVILPAPALSLENGGQKQLSELSSQLKDFRWTAGLRQQRAQVSSERGCVRPAAVYAVLPGWFELNHETLLSGRLLSAEDLSARLPSAVINRAAADALFPGQEPLGAAFRCGEQVLRVEGVAEGGFRPGESAELLIWVPLSLADAGKLHPETLELHAMADSAEQAAAFTAVINGWKSGGTAVSAPKLRMTILLPLWLLGLALGLRLLVWAARAGWKLCRKWAESLRQQLKEKYPGQLPAGTWLRLPALLGMLAAFAAAVYGWLRLAAAPLYVFPEWVPEAFVDPKAVGTTLLSLLRGAAVSVTYTSRLSTLAGLSASLTLWGSLLLTLGLLLRFSRSVVLDRGR